MSTSARRSRRRKTYAERVLVEGRWVHPDGPHGSPSTYGNKGCRCAPCSRAWADKMRARREQRMAGRVEVLPGRSVVTAPVQHGKACTYTNWRCQCDACLEAHGRDTARYQRVRRARQVAS